MKILLNPKSGAPIKEVQIKGQIYFPEAWEISSVKKFEDNDVADILVGLYGFLQELSLEDAEKYIEDEKRRNFPCDKCDFVSVSVEGLKKHQEKHLKEEELEQKLGLDVVKSKKGSEEEKDIQKAIDEQSKKEGLTGGLVDETRPVKARF